VLIGLAVVALGLGPSGWRWPWELGDAVLALRAPRVLLAGLVGAGLAVAGIAMQVVLRNELADPYVLGLSGGASLGAVGSLALWPGATPGAGAALGGAGAAALVRVLAHGPHDPLRLLLAGVAVSGLLTSATGLLLVLAPADHLLRSATYWLFGGLGTPGWPALLAPAAALVVAAGWMWWRAERLDRLSLGPDAAAALGVEVAPLRRKLLAAAVAVTAVAVAASGLIGFVGLVVPHAARRAVGAAHRRLLPVAALGGALLVVAADAVARTAFAPREVPVGLLTAAIGGPCFLFQLRRGVR
jgi:iron complex transport system permease protein